MTNHKLWSATDCELHCCEIHRYEMAHNTMARCMSTLLDPTRVHTVVARIPEGRVASYGQIAELAGYPRRARWIGKVLSAIPSDSALPWHRVIASSGQITCPRAQDAAQRLKAEGVSVSKRRVSLTRYRWQP
ncbi:MGMT family protein [Luminiphilus syltensis]|nr:MGMT family protein [Luminiphilus syltensis]